MIGAVLWWRTWFSELCWLRENQPQLCNFTAHQKGERLRDHKRPPGKRTQRSTRQTLNPLLKGWNPPQHRLPDWPIWESGRPTVRPGLGSL